MSKPIGIDLGTTMCATAVVDKLGQPVVVRNSKGETLTPSAILFQGEERVVGLPARRAAMKNLANVVMFVKSEMANPEYRFTWGGVNYTPEELSGIILRKLKQDAEAALGEDVTDAVITVPAYFGDLERHRTRDAGRIAGLNVIDIINEPTAAAIAYGLVRQSEDQKILVFDLGGGTFDVTVMAINNGSIRVLTSNGDRELGGVYFDEEFMQYFADKFKEQFDIDPLQEPRPYQDFRERAEALKIDLSDADEAPISLSAGGNALDLDVRRFEFERLIGHYIDQTRTLTEKALADADLTPGQIEKVLLVGGSSRIPAVRRMVQELIGKAPELGFNPDEVVAIGAAIYAANERGVSVRDPSGRVLPPAKFRDVSAHSLGVLVRDSSGIDKNVRVVPKDTPIPASGRDLFSTVTDNQEEIRITILQGEDDDPEMCEEVGDAGVLRGIPPRPAGVPRILVTLEYDGSACVHVHAREEESGVELDSTIEYRSRVDVRSAAQRVTDLQVR